MSDDEVTPREFARLLSSIDASQQSGAESNKLTAETLAEIKEYMLHNDYRHIATESRVDTLEENMATLVEVMESRRSMWEFLSKVKFGTKLFVMALIAAAGTGVFKNLAKPQPVIGKNKELTVKTGIKVIK